MPTPLNSLAATSLYRSPVAARPRLRLDGASASFKRALAEADPRQVLRESHKPPEIKAKRPRRSENPAGDVDAREFRTPPPAKADQEPGGTAAADGAVLGPAAIICGIVGVVKRRKNPKLRGAVHAWVAIILGLFGPIVMTLGPFALIASMNW